MTKDLAADTRPCSSPPDQGWCASHRRRQKSLPAASTTPANGATGTDRSSVSPRRPVSSCSPPTMAPDIPVAVTHQALVRTPPRGSRSPGLGRSTRWTPNPSAMAARSSPMLVRRQVSRPTVAGSVLPAPRSASAPIESWMSAAMA